MTPKEILQEWIDCFNAADAVALANKEKWKIFLKMANGLSWNGKIRSGCEDADSSMCKTIKSFSKEVIGISSAFSNSTV